MDTVPPTPAVDLLLVSTTGASTVFWDVQDELTFAYGFRDTGSGVVAVRALISTNGAQPAWADMVHDLPTDARLVTVNQSLQHGVNYLHVAARDLLDNTAQLPPLSFLVDLTPPDCSVLTESISLRLRYSARWRCEDPESGVVVSTYTPLVSLNGVIKKIFWSAPFTNKWRGPYYSFGNGMSLKQDAAYTICVAATNGAGITSTAKCSSGITVDFTPPKKATIVNFGDKLYTAESSMVCSTWSSIRDETSGLVSLELEILLDGGMPTSLQTESLAISLAEGVEDHCVTLNAPMEVGSRYFTRLTAINGAQPSLRRVVRSRGFYIDNTPPTNGTVLLRSELPAMFWTEALLGALPSSVQNLRLRLRLADFNDFESGVVEYRVHVFSLNENNPADKTYLSFERFTHIQEVLIMQPLPEMPITALFHVLVEAVNAAGLTSGNVTSNNAKIWEGLEFSEPQVVNDSGESPVSSRYCQRRLYVCSAC